MKSLTILLFLFSGLSLFPQQKQMDTLFIFGHRYALERTGPYTRSTGNIIEVLCLHQERGRWTNFPMIGRHAKVSSYDDQGNETIVETFTGKEQGVFPLHYFMDTILLNRHATYKGGVTLRSGSTLTAIESAILIATGDTCTRRFDLVMKGPSTNLVSQVIADADSIGARYVFITGLFYTGCFRYPPYKVTFRQTCFLPVQFCLRIE